MKWLAATFALTLLGCVSPEERRQAEADWAALSPEQRVSIREVRKTEDRVRVRRGMAAMADSMEESNRQRQAQWEMQRPRTYRVRQSGYGNVTVTPQAY